jgi:hypothetical protein
MFTQITDGFMLDACRDDVTASGILFEKTADSPIVRFRTTGSENDFARIRSANELSHLFPGLLDCGFHFSSEGMGGRWIAVVFRQIRLHGLQNLGSDARGGVIIKVNHF